MQQLKKTGDALASLQSTCADLRKHINAAKTESAPVIDEANNLVSLREQVESKRRMLRDFNAHFLLSDDDQYILTNSADPVTEEFFQTLVKAKRIHADCRVLLGSENQRLGLEILERNTKQLDAAFQRLFRWIQREFKTLDLENPSMNFTMRRALRVLAERPTLFQDCLDTFAEVRERSLTDAFYVALTGTSTRGDMQRPIEFSAGEPLRYVGDMLAWAHSTAVSERESLEVLFISEGTEIAKSIQEGLESEPWSRPESGEVFDGKKALGQLVNRNLGGVSQLLRQRVEEVIRTQQEPALEYKIANLIVFYRNIFQKLLEEEDFMRTLDSVEESAMKQFHTNLAAQLDRIQREDMYLPEDLSIPQFLEEGLEQLRQLLKSYDTSAAATDTDGKALESLLEKALHPFLARTNELRDTLKVPSNECFALNCLAAARQSLAMFSFTEDDIEGIDQTARASADKLVDHQHFSFLRSAGILPLVKAMSETPEGPEAAASILDHAAFRDAKLIEAHERLDEFLPSAQMDALNELKAINNSSLAHEIVGRAVERFCADFEKLEATIVAANEEQWNRRRESGKEEEEFRSVRALFPRTSDDIRILLS